MANTITAKIGADAAPLKKTLAEAAQATAAAGKKATEESKRQAKEAQKAQADATKAHLEGQGRIKQGLTSLTGNLFRAQSGAQAASAGLQMIGDGLKLGAAGTIGLQAVTAIFDRIDDAVAKTKELREEFAKVTGPQSGAGRSTAGAIEGHLEQAIAHAEKVNEALQSPTASGFRERLADAQAHTDAADGTMEKLWASISGTTGAAFQTVKGIATGEGDEEMSQRNAKRLAEVQKAADADQGRAVDKEREIYGVREKALHLSEEEAALKAVDIATEEKKGALIAKQARIAKETGIQLNINGQLDNARVTGEMERAEIQRKAAEARLDHTEGLASAKAHGEAGLTGMFSPFKGKQAEIAATRADARRKRERASADDIPQERKDQLNAEAAGLEQQADQAAAGLAIQRGGMSVHEKNAEKIRENRARKRIAKGMREDAAHEASRARNDIANGVRPVQLAPPPAPAADSRAADKFGVDSARGFLKEIQRGNAIQITLVNT